MTFLQILNDQFQPLCPNNRWTWQQHQHKWTWAAAMCPVLSDLQTGTHFGSVFLALRQLVRHFACQPARQKRLSACPFQMVRLNVVTPECTLELGKLAICLCMSCAICTSQLLLFFRPLYSQFALSTNLSEQIVSTGGKVLAIFAALFAA